MNKADYYYKETIKDILDRGTWSINPRTKWFNGTPAQYKQVRQKVYNYNISKGEFPITSLRNTALKGCFYEMEWIYIKQSNIIEEAHPSIHSWWKDFVVKTELTDGIATFSPETLHLCKSTFPKNDFSKIKEINSIGTTYGHIVKKCNLIGKLLYDMEHNWESRRLNIDLWQEGELNTIPKPLPPCAYRTEWAVEEVDIVKQTVDKINNAVKCEWAKPLSEIRVRYIDFTLYQRSRDLLLTFSINPFEYVLLAMMVANHLTFKTGMKHHVRNFQHSVFNEHIYDLHFDEAKEILERESLEAPTVEMVCEPKDFFSHTIEDFKFNVDPEIKKRNNKLPIAI